MISWFMSRFFLFLKQFSYESWLHVFWIRTVILSENSKTLSKLCVVGLKINNDSKALRNSFAFLKINMLTFLKQLRKNFIRECRSRKQLHFYKIFGFLPCNSCDVFSTAIFLSKILWSLDEIIRNFEGISGIRKKIMKPLASVSKIFFQIED